MRKKRIKKIRKFCICMLAKKRDGWSTRWFCPSYLAHVIHVRRGYPSLALATPEAVSPFVARRRLLPLWNIRSITLQRAVHFLFPPPTWLQNLLDFFSRLLEFIFGHLKWIRLASVRRDTRSCWNVVERIPPKFLEFCCTRKFPASSFPLILLSYQPLNAKNIILLSLAKIYFDLGATPQDRHYRAAIQSWLYSSGGPKRDEYKVYQRKPLRN